MAVEQIETLHLPFLIFTCSKLFILSVESVNEPQVVSVKFEVAVDAAALYDQTHVGTGRTCKLKKRPSLNGAQTRAAVLTTKPVFTFLQPP